MSSNIAARRPVARTRSMALKNENAIVPVTRTNRTTLAAAKEVIDDGAAGPSAAGPSKPVATKATTGVLGTRKRAALGDLTNAHRAKSTSAAPTGLKDDVKGKTVVKEAVRSRSATTSSRGKSAEIASAAGAPKRVVHAQDDAMAVDENAPQGDEARPVKNSRRVASQSTTSRTRHSSTSAVSTTSTSARRATASSRTTTKQAAGKSTHVGSSRTSVKAEPGLEEDEEVQAEAREHKRVKTEQAAETQVGPAKDEGWEDLDKEDADDPLMVSEYVNEIFDYMKTIEIKCMPSGDYMANQRDINWHLRGVLVDWLIDVHAKFRLLPETLFLTLNIIDRFLSVRTISLSKLQLVGVTAMFVAAKYEEVLCPSVQNFLYLADGGYTDEEILRAERYMIRVLDFNLSYANPMNFLRRISKADNYDIQTRTVAKYFMEISLVDYRLLEHPPSLVAAAAVWMARLVLERGEWTPTLVHYSSYSEVELLGTAEIMLDYCLRPIAHLAFHKKYSGRKFMRASVYVEDWARNTFPEGAVPDVEADTQDFNVLRIDLFDRMGLVRPDALLGVAEETYVAQVEAEAIPAPKEEPLHEVTNLRQAANQRRAVA